jgi:hypothetical protein
MESVLPSPSKLGGLGIPKYIGTCDWAGTYSTYFRRDFVGNYSFALGQSVDWMSTLINSASILKLMCYHSCRWRQFLRNHSGKPMFWASKKMLF